jgi:MFS family permease
LEPGPTDHLQIFSFISVGELMAPVLGGVLYRKTGYAGVFGLGCALLAVDFILRILVIEKKVAAKYDESFYGPNNPREYGTRNEDENQDQIDEESSGPSHDANGDGNEDESPNDTSRPRTEHDHLLPKATDDEDDDDTARYAVPAGQNRLIRTLPILYCLTDARLLVALLVAFVQAALLATFDATIPTEAQSLFSFDSLQSGLLFIALDIPYLVLGPVAGWCVDRYGTKPASVFGFGYLVPTLVLLRLPPARLTPTAKSNVVLFCALLALNGIGLAAIGSPSIVEASDVVQRYDEANPGLFGENGPYAQLYAFNSLVFSAGLTIGPILSGGLRDAIGYGNMNVVVAAISALTALLSFFFIGGNPRLLTRWK